MKKNKKNSKRTKVNREIEVKCYVLGVSFCFVLCFPESKASEAATANPIKVAGGATTPGKRKELTSG